MITPELYGAAQDRGCGWVLPARREKQEYARIRPPSNAAGSAQQQPNRTSYFDTGPKSSAQLRALEALFSLLGENELYDYGNNYCTEDEHDHSVPPERRMWR
jgi:hypothetical protein